MIKVLGNFYLFEAFNPEEISKPLQFRLRKDFALDYYKNGQEYKYYELENIDEVLRSPTAIFNGLRREDFGDGICYCGKPARRYTNEHVDVPVDPKMVFAVYIGGNGVIFQWRFEPADKEDGNLLENRKLRFDKQTWIRC